MKSFAPCGSHYNGKEAKVVLPATPEEIVFRMATNITFHEGHVTYEERCKLLGQQGVTLWLTGLSASGKSTIATALEQHLLHQKVSSFRLDGDNVRFGLNKDLGFSPKDREENIRRIAEVRALFRSRFRTDRWPSSGLPPICFLVLCHDRLFHFTLQS